MGIVKRITRRILGTVATYATQKAATKVAQKVSSAAAKRKMQREKTVKSE